MKKSKNVYCALMRMLHSHFNNNEISYLHEKCLRLAYNDKRFSYEELLQKDRSVYIYQKNIPKLAIEMFKTKIALALEKIKDSFCGIK